MDYCLLLYYSIRNFFAVYWCIPAKAKRTLFWPLSNNDFPACMINLGEKT